MIRVVLPTHLRTLAGVDDEVMLDVDGPVTQRSVLDALEARYPMLRGTSATRSPGSGGRSCASSPASGICRTNRRRPACPTRSCACGAKRP